MSLELRWETEQKDDIGTRVDRAGLPGIHREIPSEPGRSQWRWIPCWCALHASGESSQELLDPGTEGDIVRCGPSSCARNRMPNKQAIRGRGCHCSSLPFPSLCSSDMPCDPTVGSSKGGRGHRKGSYSSKGERCS